MEASFVQIAFAPRQHSSVITEIEDECIVQKTVLSELINDTSNRLIHFLNLIDVPSLRESKGLVVRVIRCRRNGGGIVFYFLIGNV